MQRRVLTTLWLSLVCVLLLVPLWLGADADRTAVPRALQELNAKTVAAYREGRYHDSFHRIDGLWWFDTRVMLVDLVGDLSRHLLYELD